MADEEKNLTAGRGWARLTRSLGRGVPSKVAKANRLARRTQALVSRRKR